MKTPSSLKNFELRWKKGYWYFSMAFNFLVPASIATNRVMVAKGISSTSISHVVLLAVLPFVCATFLLLYGRGTWKHLKDYREIIKPERTKYLYRGLTTSFVSWNLLLIALVVSYAAGESTATTAVIYTIFGICCTLGLCSSVFISIYEFCVSFDVFYNKNKEKIIAAHLEREREIKIMEDAEKNQTSLDED